MHKISLGTVPHTTEDFSKRAEHADLNVLPHKPARARLRLRHLRLLVISVCAIAATACASLKAPDDPAMVAAQAEVDAAVAAAAAAQKDAEMARSEADAAMQDAEMARSEADAAMQDAEAAMQDAEMARSEADAAMQDAEMARSDADEASELLMIAMAPHPAEVMVSPDQFDPSLLSMDDARASLAGPDSIYVSSIMYDGQTYSALLTYSGGTTATVESIFGEHGKLIPDSVDLGRTRLFFKAPDKLAVSNVAVGSAGYSGELQYVGGNQLQVTGLSGVILPPTSDEQIANLRSELAAAEARLIEADIAAGDARAEAEASMADAEASRAERDAEMLARSEAEIRAEDAEVAQWLAETDAAAARAELEAMIADAFQPSAVMISDGQIDPSMTSFADARIAIAGPDSVYVSSIMYDGQHYSALLKYTGGTTAEVEQIFGSSGKMIPDSVDLSQAELVFVSPNAWEVSNVSVGGMGYSGTLAYTGNGKLQVTSIRQVELPPTTMELLAEANANLEAALADNSAKSEQIDSLEADLQAEKDALAEAQANVAAAQAAADAAQEAADMANAELDAIRMDMHQPSEVMVSFADLDAGLADFDNARASLAGPDAIYVSNIMYDGRPYSALLRYKGGTTAIVKQVFGPDGKLIPDSVGLAMTDMAFMSPDSFAVSNVAVGGIGYSGTLQYTGNGQLQVTGIRRVTLPPTEAEKAAAAIEMAEADAARKVSEAMADADARVNAAMADADAQVSEAMASVAAAEEELSAIKMAMHQPSAVRVAFSQLDARLVNFDSAQVSLAGPDTVYVSSIMYDGQPYSALLKYHGGTSATVQYVFGPVGKLIPDSVDLSQTTVALQSPDSFAVSNVGVAGAGYSGTLQYTGDGQLQVSGISRVTLPTPPEELLADALAQLAELKRQLDNANATTEELRVALSAANDALAAANSELAAANTAKAAAQQRMEELEAELSSLVEGSALPGLNASLLDLERVSLTPAGPNEIYISGIQYGGANVSARIRYDAGTATATALFEGPNLVADSLQLDAAQASVQEDRLVVANVGIEGRAHTLTLTRGADGSVSVSANDDGWNVRTRGELARDNLIRADNFVVNGFTGGQALPGEGSWTSEGGSVLQTDATASHAKFSIAADQSAAELLFGFTAGAGGDKVGFGLHILASATPRSGNTWNYGKSYLLWVTRDPFYDSEDLHLQFYESADDNTLMWLASSRIPHGRNSMINVEALYRDTGMTTLLVNGEEQLTVNIGLGISGGDTIALRSLGGPVEFTQVYVAAQ